MEKVMFRALALMMALVALAAAPALAAASLVFTVGDFTGRAPAGWSIHPGDDDSIIWLRSPLGDIDVFLAVNDVPEVPDEYVDAALQQSISGAVGMVFEYDDSFEVPANEVTKVMLEIPAASYMTAFSSGGSVYVLYVFSAIGGGSLLQMIATMDENAGVNGYPAALGNMVSSIKYNG